jgi:hypothetical protein
MADDNKKKELTDLLNKASREFKKEKADRSIDYGVNHPDFFSSFMIQLDHIADDKQRKLLKKLAKLIHQMREDGLEMDKMAVLIKLYKDISYTLDGNLIPSVRERFERIVGKEVKFVKMQEPDNSDIWEIGDMAVGAAANLQSLKAKKNLGEQEVLLNEYLMEILDYRLASLPDEAAWDFVAQSVLIHSKKEFIS